MTTVPLRPRLLVALGCTLLLGACATPTPRATPAVAARSADTGLDRMERLAVTANRCWFRSKDPAFARYTLAPELSSFSGKPRFLLVPRNRPEERPLLVVEGRSGSTAVETYGPILQTDLRARVESDLERWNRGSDACAGA